MWLNANRYLSASCAEVLNAHLQMSILFALYSTLLLQHNIVSSLLWFTFLNVLIQTCVPQLTLMSVLYNRKSFQIWVLRLLCWKLLEDLIFLFTIIIFQWLHMDDFTACFHLFRLPKVTTAEEVCGSRYPGINARLRPPSMTIYYSNKSSSAKVE